MKGYFTVITLASLFLGLIGFAVYWTESAWPLWALVFIDGFKLNIK